MHRARVQDSTVRFKALAACRITPRASLNRVQSAAYQKSVARRQAFGQWAKEWEEERRRRFANDSFAYEYAITRPPDGNNHPLWTAAVKPNKGDPTPSRHTTSTALRLAVGHAFISDYTRRFRPDIPADERYCACGYEDHSFIHILYECPRYQNTRWLASEELDWTHHPPDFFFSETENARIFLKFLHHSRAAFKPPSRLEAPFDPG